VANLRLTDDRKTWLRIIKYETEIKALPQGLMVAHFAVVHPEKRPESETREVYFSIPTALQDDPKSVLYCWAKARENLRESYAEAGLNVDIDLRRPMRVWYAGQQSVPAFVKEIVNGDSAPHNMASVPFIG